MSSSQDRRVFWAGCADAVGLVLLALAAQITLNGGFAVRVLGLRLSAQSPGRSVAAGILLLIVRHLFVPKPTLFELARRWCKDAARGIRRLPDDSAVLGEAVEKKVETRSRTVWTSLAVTAVFIALTVLMTYPQARQLGTSVSEDIGDPLLSTWRLAWVAHQIVRDPLHLFDANIFYPSRYTLAYSDAVLVPALMAAPLFWTGVPPLVAYNLIFLSAFVLSGVGMFLLVRSLTGRTAAAFVAGFVFAFLPYRFMHYAHLELQMAQWMPFCLWSFHRTLKSGRLRDGLVTGAFFALQTVSCMYYGIFFATVMVPFAIVLLIAAGRERARPALRALAAGGVLAGVLVAPVIPPYLAARATVGDRPVWEIQHYSATPANYFAAHSRNVLLGDYTGDWGQQERELFQGITVLALAAVALWPPLSSARLGYALALLVAFDASLGLNGISYPWLHAFVLPYKGLRVPARMAMLVGLALSVLVGYGMARLLSTRNRRRGWMLAAAAAALIFVEYRERPKLAPVPTYPVAVYAQLADDPQSILLELPLKAPDIYLEPVYMYFSTFHWHRLVNGYSGFSPVIYADLVRLVRWFPDEASIDELRRRKVSVVIVHQSLYEYPGEYKQTIAAIERNAHFTLVGTTMWERRETRIYRLRPL